MRLALVGLSFKTAPIELREQLAAQLQPLPKTLRRLLQLDGIEEACVIATCNRLEVYTSGSREPSVLRRHVRLFLGEAAALPLQTLEPHLVQADGPAALHHLFRVASSLESMVVGEPQILGQVKESFRMACDEQSVGAELSKVFQRSFKVAKRIRTETGIAENAVSMSFAAVELGRQIFEDLAGKNVLLVGAGKMGSLAAKHLRSHGVKQVRVASRSIQTAERVAKQIGGIAASLQDLPLLLSQADIVICSTAAPGFVIDKRMVGSVMRNRRFKALLFVDIAVPRDVDPRVGELDNVFVYDVDDLQAVLQANRDQRRHEAEAAEALVRAELDAFLAWLNAQQVVPVIKALRQKALSIAEAEAQRTLASAGTDPKLERRIRAMSTSIVNKLLHPVFTELKAKAESGDPDALSQTIARLFELPAETPEPISPSSPSNLVRLPQQR
ncbi:MAG: glutamyl-tRNA reductase [Myxococcota bacterium]